MPWMSHQGDQAALGPDGLPAFSRLQAAMDEGRTNDLMFFAFDLLYLDGKSTSALPLIERNERDVVDLPRRQARLAQEEG